MEHKEKGTIVVTVCLTIAFDNDPERDIESQSEELRTNAKAVIDRGFDNGDFSQGTECELSNVKESITTMFIPQKKL